MHRIQCIDTLHRLKSIENNAYNTMHVKNTICEIQCKVNNADNTLHVIQCKQWYA